MTDRLVLVPGTPVGTRPTHRNRQRGEGGTTFLDTGEAVHPPILFVVPADFIDAWQASAPALAPSSRSPAPWSPVEGGASATADAQTTTDPACHAGPVE